MHSSSRLVTGTLSEARRCVVGGMRSNEIERDRPQESPAVAALPHATHTHPKLAHTSPPPVPNHRSTHPPPSWSSVRCQIYNTMLADMTVINLIIDGILKPDYLIPLAFYAARAPTQVRREARLGAGAPSGRWGWEEGARVDTGGVCVCGGPEARGARLCVARTRRRARPAPPSRSDGRPPARVAPRALGAGADE